MTTPPEQLPSLLAQAYVAHTVEFDNLWEARLLKRGVAPRFLVSYALWANCMRHVPADGIAVEDLAAACGVWNGPVHLGRMEEWWGYLTTTDGIVRPSVGGTMALEAWEGLDDVVHGSWVERFGGERMDALVGALTAIERANDLDLPDTMPALGYADGYATPVPDGGPASPAGAAAENVGALLARVLLAFTLECEQGASVPVATAAVILGALDVEPVGIKELPALTAVRKEAIAPAIKFLDKRGFVATDGKGASMRVALAPDGVAARAARADRVAEVEQRWVARHGSAVADLRTVLRSLYEPDGDGGGPALGAGLVPPDRGWRAGKAYLAQTDLMIADPSIGLPRHPMLTHRGAWPDGA